MKISYSAPAKVILSGEHAVVYGKPALVSAIDLRLKFSLWSQEIKINDKNILFISQKVKDYLKNKKIPFFDQSFNFKVESEVLIGRGLGSSAALSVAAVAAFLDFYTGGRNFEKEIINILAYQIEKHFHRNPSGVDNSTSCFGGLIFYRKEFEFLKNITQLNIKLPKNIEERLLLIDSGKPQETTMEMINLVGKFYSRAPKAVEKILYEIEKITKKMTVSIVRENSSLLKKCLVENEKILEELGLVSEKTKKLLIDLSTFGSGKITGAGGREINSGFILFLSDSKEKLIDFLDKNKIAYYQFVQDYQGLKKICKSGRRHQEN